MEGHPSGRAEVDTTRPFRSVKEAVAIFGERILAGDAYSSRRPISIPNRREITITPKTISKPVYPPPPPPIPLYSATSSPPSYSSSSSHFNQDPEDHVTILSSIKTLEAELDDARWEISMLKKRESETEVAVASLNAALHKSMLRLAEIESAGPVKSPKVSMDIDEQMDEIGSERWGEERQQDFTAGLKYLPSLAQVLSLGEMGGSYDGRRKKKTKKKKPIVPLIGDVFSRKKASGDLEDSLYTRPYYSVLS